MVKSEEGVGKCGKVWKSGPNWAKVGQSGANRRERWRSAEKWAKVGQIAGKGGIKWQSVAKFRERWKSVAKCKGELSNICQTVRLIN